ncbi:MAG: EcsC family protein [Clostridiales bacterium]|nr:EcsC family protein [Clostridiales bacterium]
MFIKRKSPYEKEIDALLKKEEAFFASRVEKKESFLNKKLEEKVPDQLQGKLDAAFAKAFELIFEKGTVVIEKTYMKDKAEVQYFINEVNHYHKGSRKTLKAFSKKAKGTGRKNLLISGTTGIGLGLLGVGIPDIPVFTAMIMKAIYEIATSYGYEYESDEEKAFILLIIEGALSYGDVILEIDDEINDYIQTGELPYNYDRQVQIKHTAGALSKELLYMKFLQGIPILGAVGGFYDAIYMKRITEYAGLKYKRRFLTDKR